MSENKQLQMITEYKQPYSGAVSIGDLLQPYTSRSGERAENLVGRMTMAIRQVVESPFKECCHFGGFTGGVLVIHVDDPAMVYLFRRKYLFELREQLTKLLPDVNIIDIRFKANKM